MCHIILEVQHLKVLYGYQAPGHVEFPCGQVSWGQVAFHFHLPNG